MRSDDGSFGRTSQDQLTALGGACYFNLPADTSRWPAFPAPSDDAAPAEARARAMLDTNCAFCHQPTGTASSMIDLRSATPLAQMGVCNVDPGQGDLDIAGSKLLKPGDPDHSILPYRMDSVDPEIKMPELPNLLPDEEGIALVREWIAGLDGSCEP